jgi:hypothetical protein
LQLNVCKRIAFADYTIKDNVLTLRGVVQTVPSESSATVLKVCVCRCS